MAFHKTALAIQVCRHKTLCVNHTWLHSCTYSHVYNEGPTYEMDILVSKVVD